jgi:long-chain acyl-CoA synthetase
MGNGIPYPALDQLSDLMAARLAAGGIRKGDRVGLYCINSHYFVASYFGIVKAGAVVVPVNLLLNPHEVAYILADAGAQTLLYHEAMGEAVKRVRQMTPGITSGICLGTQPAEKDDLTWEQALEPAGHPPEIPFDTGEDLAAIIYTSGTTGKPKGAMLTHANLAANTASVQKALQLEPGNDTVVTVLPMFHSFAATAGMLTPLFHGCSVVPLPKFDPEQVARTIERTGATLFMGVPSMYSVLLHLPEPFTPCLSSLKHCVSGGAAMPEEVMRQFEQRYGKVIYEGDGPTECSPVTCCNPIGGTRKLGSVGVPVPEVEMKILDDEGAEVPTGTIGEICVRGPNVMKGYWNQAEETAASFFGEWFRTGDLGNVDEDGYFFIVDRKKDMIIVNGMNVYPRVIEEILYQHPAVREAAVVGEPSGLHGEIPVAYVAAKEGKNPTAAELRGHCREFLGRHEVPRKIVFMPDLPKNAAGKIVKRALRKQGEIERGINGD